MFTIRIELVFDHLQFEYEEFLDYDIDKELKGEELQRLREAADVIEAVSLKFYLFI